MRLHFSFDHVSRYFRAGEIRGCAVDSARDLLLKVYWTTLCICVLYIYIFLDGPVVSACGTLFTFPTYLSVVHD